MPSKKLDLFLGGPLGLWALQQVLPADVNQVFTLDAEILQTATALGIKVAAGNANEANAGSITDDDSVDVAAGGVGLSVHYPRIIRPPLLRRYQKLYNLHPGYLPWGRGFYPVFWAMWEQTPAGASLHEMTAGVDEGPIVAQRRVAYHDDDTGGSLHARVTQAEKQLFLDYWPGMLAGADLETVPQPTGQGSYHTKSEFFALKQQTPLGEMNAAELLRLIRCLTFPGFSGLEVSMGEKKFEVHLEPMSPDGK